jgi:hypothetical protein
MQQMEDGVTTRFITGALIVALWAGYEAAVTKYANYVREAKSLSLKLRDIRGDFSNEHANTSSRFCSSICIHRRPTGTGSRISRNSGTYWRTRMAAWRISPSRTVTR